MKKRKYIVLDRTNGRYFNGLRDVDTGYLVQCDAPQFAQDFETIQKAQEWMGQCLGAAQVLCQAVRKED